jgi:exodeoxyribonuclease VII large subunit
VAGTRVQGDGAAQGIVQALEDLNRRDDVDVIILARGGGSLEELWPFNEEAVARAIYASKLPVVSGVGHETDFTIADFVADVRAPTPSAAAEIVTPSVAVLREQVDTLQARLRQHLSDIVLEHRHGLASLRQRLWFHVPNVEEHKRRLDDLCQSINMALSRQTSLLYERCESLTRRLEAMNPADTLRRGYAIVQRHRDQAIISRIGQVQAGEALKITVGNGDFPATAGGEHKPSRHRKKTETYVARPLF